MRRGRKRPKQTKENYCCRITSAPTLLSINPQGFPSPFRETLKPQGSKPPISWRLLQGRRLRTRAGCLALETAPNLQGPRPPGVPSGQQLGCAFGGVCANLGFFEFLNFVKFWPKVLLLLGVQKSAQVSLVRRAYFSAPFSFFWLPLFFFVLAQERNKERKKRGDAYVERAGPQAPKGVLCCNTLKP